MKKKIILLLIVILQCSCAIAIIAGAAASIIIYDRRRLNTMHDDILIVRQIKNEIKNNKSFNGSRINVVSFNRILLISGQLTSADLKITLDKIARQNHNIYRIYDETKVNKPITLEQQAQDAWITSQVRSTLIATRHLESGSLRVITEDQTVYLMGTVTKDQADLAAEEIRLIPKVKQVVRVFQYIQ